MGGLNYTCLCDYFSPVDHDKWCNRYLEYFEQNSEHTTRKQASSTTEPNAQSTTQDYITTNQEIISSSFELSESTETSNDVPSSTIQSSTANTRSSEKMHTSTEQNEIKTNKAASLSETHENHPPTEPTANTNPPEKINSSTERNQPISSNEVLYSSTSLNQSAPTFTEDEFHYVLIYSTATKIKAWYLATGEHKIIEDSKDSTALAGTPEHIYYATVDDNEGGTIFRTFTDPANSHPPSSHIVWMGKLLSQFCMSYKQYDDIVLFMAMKILRFSDYEHCY